MARWGDAPLHVCRVFGNGEDAHIFGWLPRWSVICRPCQLFIGAPDRWDDAIAMACTHVRWAKHSKGSGRGHHERTD